MLEKSMRRLSEYFEHSFELENLARFETFYTKLLVLAMIFIPTLPILVLGTFREWLPVFLKSLGSVVIVVALLWYGWRGLMRLGFLRQGIDRMKMLVPWIGGIVRKGAIARWCRSMAMLYDAGVPVHAALGASSLASGNAALGASVNRLSYMVLAGEPVSAGMKESGEFPDQAIGMMITGEKSGSVSTSLEKVAEFYEEEVRVSGKQAVLLASMGIYGLVLAVMAFQVISGWTGYYKGIMNTYGNWGE
jgi:type IV pilus assembly protein PilC